MNRDNTGGIVAIMIVVILALCALCGCAAAPLPIQVQPCSGKCDQKIAVVGDITAVRIYPTYDTIEQAAIAGFKSIAADPISPYYEFGAEIVKTPDGKFLPLTPMTDFEGDRVHVGDRELEKLGILVGSYHTHPCLPDHYVEFFSSDDLEEPIFYHRTAFMGDFCTGNVHEFKPGDKPDAQQPDNDEKSFYLSKGRLIGKFIIGRPQTKVLND